MPEASPFRTWNGRDSWEFVDGVRIHAIGGEQVMLCHVKYEAGTRVARHSHPTAEQVMWIVEGDVTMTIADETKTLGAGDVRMAFVYDDGRGRMLDSKAPLSLGNPELSVATRGTSSSIRTIDVAGERYRVVAVPTPS